MFDMFNLWSCPWRLDVRYDDVKRAPSNYRYILYPLAEYIFQGPSRRELLDYCYCFGPGSILNDNQMQRS